MSFARALATVSGLTLLSRVLGFVRDLLTAAILGAGPLADAFFVALKLPNLFRRLFAEGAFAVAFVPLYTERLTHESGEAARRFAQQALAMLLTVLLPFTLLAMMAMPAVVGVIAPGFRGAPEIFEAAVALTRITFPYLPAMALVALMGGMLNAHDRFAPFAAAPILFNLSLIFALLGVTPRVGEPSTGLAWGVALAGALQLIWMAWCMGRAGLPLSLPWPRMTPALKKLLLLMGPAALGAGVTQINVFVDTLLASLIGGGAVSYLYYADRLHQLPMGVVGIALSTALLPLLARHIAAENEIEAQRIQNRAVEIGLLLALPAAAALMVVPGPILSGLFERGAFTNTDTQFAALALAAYAVGLPGTIMIKALSTGFFARQDTTTPLRIAVVVMVVNALASIILVFTLPQGIAHAGIALATGIAGWLNSGLLAATLMRRGHWRLDAQLKRRMPRLVLSAIGMGAVLFGAAHILAPLWTGGEALRLIGLGMLVLSGLIGYFALVFLSRGAEIADLRRLKRP